MSGGRHGARRLLLQALYQHQLGGHGQAELLAQFTARRAFRNIDGDYFRRMLAAVLADTGQLDARIAACADRPVAQLDPIERAVLWIGLAELSACQEVPAGVAINEAIELAKEFGAVDSYRYVNAVLDSAARERRD